MLIYNDQGAPFFSVAMSLQDESPKPKSPPLLQAVDIEAGYGPKTIVQGVTLEVHCGEVVLVIGHNGAGKSTLLKTLFGLLPASFGTITYEGQSTSRCSVADRLRAGMVYLPQGQRVFPDLSVLENIEIATNVLPSSDRAARVDRALSVFPRLRGMIRRRAGTLSGGEQQMVALARSLVYMPRLLMLDEPSLGLSPAMVQQSLDMIGAIRRDVGAGILLVEQKIKSALTIADRVYVLKNGKVTFRGRAEILADELALKAAFL